MKTQWSLLGAWHGACVPNSFDFHWQGCKFSGNQAPTAAAIYSRMSSTDVASNSNLDPSDVEYADH